MQVKAPEGGEVTWEMKGLAGAGSLRPAKRRRRQMAWGPKDTAGFVARRARRRQMRHEAMRNTH